MAKNAVNKTFTRTTATGDWISYEPPGGDSELLSDAQSSIQSAGAIIEGRSILVDIDDGDITGMVEIAGDLLFTNEYPTGSLYVGELHGEETGRLLFGTVGDPIANTNRHIIEFNGDPPVDPLRNDGHYRGLMAHGSEDDETGFEFVVHAAPKLEFCRIDGHLEEDDTSLVLAEDPVGWVIGDECCITYPGFYGEGEAHEFIITGISGRTISFSGHPLPWDCWGTLQYLVDGGDSGVLVEDEDAGWSDTPGALTLPDGTDEDTIKTTLDERPMVANLTRPIVIRGVQDAHLSADGFGGHLMIMNRWVKIQWNGGVRLEFMGQQGHMGRYPLHPHMNSRDSSSNGSQILGPEAAIPTSIATATTLTVPPLTTMVFLEAWPESDIWFTTDGSTPVANSVGTQVAAGGKSSPITSWTSIKVIQESSNGSVKAVYNKGDGSFIGATPEGYGQVNGCVFMNCPQRGLVIHGTDGWTGTRNIFYKITGHSLFFEDGSEEDNEFYDNLFIGGIDMPLGVGTHGFPLCLQDHEKQFGGLSDGGRLGASAIWNTNPKNHIGGPGAQNWTFGYPGTGTWNAFPVATLGLSVLVDEHPINKLLGEHDNYNFGHGLHGEMTRLPPVCSIRNAGVHDPLYRPTSDEQPAGDYELERQIRFTLSSTNIKCKEGYVNLVSWPDYTNWLNADCHGGGLTGVTGQGIGPVVDPLTGLTQGVVSNFVNSGPTLSVMPMPAAWGTAHPFGMATYHYTVVPWGGFFVNYPWEPEATSGALRGSGALGMTDLYLSPMFIAHTHLKNLRLLNSSLGNHLRPPYITGTIQGTGKCFASVIPDPEGYYGYPGKFKVWPDAAGDWSTGNYFSYDALNLVNAPGGSPGEHGYLIDNRQYAARFDIVDGTYTTARAHTVVTRNDNSGAAVGTWIIPSGRNTEQPDNGEEVVCAVTGSMWTMGQGNSHMAEYLIDAGTISSSFRFIIESLLTSADEILLGFQNLPNTPSVVSVLPTSHGELIEYMSSVGSKALVKSGDGFKYHYDSTLDILWIKLIGGWQPTDYGTDTDLTLPLVLDMAV